ncbi:MAG TPA: hypothetical protein VIU64_11660 [Polyangia bacterium]
MIPSTVSPRALIRPLLLLAAATGVASCAPLRLPAENAGTARSREGVELGVTRQACSQNVDPDFPNADLVEERVELQVRNATSAPITIQRDGFQLIAPDGTALRPLTWRAGDPMNVKGGESRTFELRYMTRGSLACDGEMKLEPDGSIRLAHRAVTVGAIRFRPRAAM